MHFLPSYHFLSKQQQQQQQQIDGLLQNSNFSQKVERSWSVFVEFLKK
jgi:hypothetical protein